jgi:hypothetical protein
VAGATTSKHNRKPSAPRQAMRHHRFAGDNNRMGIIAHLGKLV